VASEVVKRHLKPEAPTMKRFPTLVYATVALMSSLFEHTHGFSGALQRSSSQTLNLNRCKRCTINRARYPQAVSSLLNTREKTLFMSASNDDDRSETEFSPIQILIDTIKSDPSRSIYFSTLMTICGASLGPFLDSYHSLFGVLSYDTPLVFPLLGSIGGSPALLTCVTTYWVPVLFGVAGFLIGWLYIWLDAVFHVEENSTNQSQSELHPTVPKVMAGISYFTVQYFLSGILFANQVDRTSMLALMTTLAAGGFSILDGTLSGFITSAATAIGGPLIEVGLISFLPAPWGYHYNDAGETGFFPLWIIPVYFLGGPANGNLARLFWNTLGGETVESAEDAALVPPISEKISCSTCQRTRAVPCGNCDGIGQYWTYGVLVTCKACRGKGRVICRSCFSQYGDDPNDIENIRQIMDQIPD